MKVASHVVQPLGRILRSPWTYGCLAALLLMAVVIGGCYFWLLSRAADQLFSGESDYVDFKTWSEVSRATYHELEPQWSFDGSQIVFKKLRVQNAVWTEGDVYSIRSDGSQLKSISKNAYWPRVSPDGLEVAYGTTRKPRDPPFYIETSKVDGSDKRRLTEHRLSDVAPAWSPDGKRIAFTRLTTVPFGDRGIYVMDTDGSNLHWLHRFRSVQSGDAAGDSYRWGPAWSPDGEMLAFVVQQYSTDSIYEFVNRNVLYTIRADGSDVVVAFAATRGKTTTGGRIAIDQIWGKPVWSPDGRRLAFTRIVRSDYKDFEAGEKIEAPPGGSLFTVNADGSELRRVAEFGDTVHPSALFWSPDGTDILYTFNLEGSIYVGSVNKGSHRKIWDGSYASFSPDGSRIAVIDVRDPESAYSSYLYIMSASGSDVQPLVWIDEDGDLKTVR